MADLRDKFPNITLKLRRCANLIEKFLDECKLTTRILVILAFFLLLSIQLLLYIIQDETVPKSATTRLEHLCQKLAKGYDEDKLDRVIYVITPTHERFVQKAELTRLASTLMLVPNIHWILVEDSMRPTEKISRFIRFVKTYSRFSSITHLFALTPAKFKLKPGEPDWKYPKGVWQRNKALEWLKYNHQNIDLDGFIYFADDDNTYDLRLFDEIRKTKRISVWPVAFAGGLLVEGPIVDPKNSSRVASFNSRWKPERSFPIDMAGFSISVKLFLTKEDLRFSSDQPIGYIESNFIGQLIASPGDLEPRANRCKDVLVWHTKTKQPSLHEETKLKISSNHDSEV